MLQEVVPSAIASSPLNAAAFSTSGISPTITSGPTEPPQATPGAPLGNAEAPVPAGVPGKPATWPVDARSGSARARERSV